MLADDAGDRIVAMLHKAAGMAKEESEFTDPPLPLWVSLSPSCQ